jgi:hypothetical protein
VNIQHINPKFLMATLSVLATVLAIFTSADLFIFSKIIKTPQWATHFPDPMLPAWLIALITLLPLLHSAVSKKDMLIIAVSSIFIAVIAWCATHHVANLQNLLFQFFWVLLLSFLVPLLVIALIKQFCLPFGDHT